MKKLLLMVTIAALAFSPLMISQAEAGQRAATKKQQKQELKKQQKKEHKKQQKKQQKKKLAKHQKAKNKAARV